MAQPNIRLTKIEEDGQTPETTKVEFEILVEGERGLVPLIPKETLGDIRDDKAVELGRDMGNFFSPTSGVVRQTISQK